jgi:hypothetical protein
MIKVYQTHMDKINGNCMQAVIASLLELPLDDVPNFAIAENNSWYSSLINFCVEQGCEHIKELYNLEESRLRGQYFESYKEHYDKMNAGYCEFDLEHSEGINGYFYATVFSPKYVNLEDKSPGLHAVVCDKDFNIVYDPNPNYKDLKEYPYAKELGYNGIITVEILNKKLT